MLLLNPYSINPNPFNLQTCFRMLVAAINLSFNLFWALHINDETKTSYALLFSAILFSVSCLLPVSLQPKRDIKTFSVSSFNIGFTYVSIYFRVAPINGLNRVLHLFSFELNYFLRIPLTILVPGIYAFRPNFMALLKSVLPDFVAFFIW